jgi:hypothetical protein
LLGNNQMKPYPVGQRLEGSPFTQGPFLDLPGKSAQQATNFRFENIYCLGIAEHLK